MSYIKHVWNDGETITAERLNNIENGIEEIDLNYFNKQNIVDEINNNSTNDQLPTARAIRDFFERLKTQFDAENMVW